MTDFDPQLLQSLGLAPDVRLDEVSTVDLPGPPVGEGKGLVPLAAVALLQLVQAQPDFHSTGLAMESMTIEAWEHDRGVLRVAPAIRVAAHGGEVIQYGRSSLLVDGRSRSAAIRTGDFVLRVQDGSAVVYRISGSSASAPDLPTVDVSQLLGSWTGDEWLHDAAAELAASPSLLDRMAGLGLLGRLWHPAAEEDARSIVDQAATGSIDSPTTRAQQQAAALPVAVLEDVASLALHAVDSLQDLLERCEQLVIEEPEQASLHVQELISRRDELESVAFVLRAAGRAEQLDSALDALDAEVESRASAFHFVPIPSPSPRLSTVAWREPTAWWAALGAST